MTDDLDDMMTNPSDDIELDFERQEQAMALLERLRIAEPLAAAPAIPAGGGRRDSRRWPCPDDISIQIHDTTQWQPVACVDIGLGGARLAAIPVWMQGPAPLRLKASAAHPILVLADVMWREAAGGGVRFEFGDPEERDQWTAALIDALLAKYSLT